MNKFMLFSFLGIFLPFGSGLAQTNATSTGSGMDWTIRSGYYSSQPSKIVVDGDGSLGGSILLQSQTGVGGVGNINLDAVGGNISFKNSGTEAMTFTSGGKLGIGIKEPLLNLQILGVYIPGDRGPGIRITSKYQTEQVHWDIRNDFNTLSFYKTGLSTPPEGSMVGKINVEGFYTQKIFDLSNSDYFLDPASPDISLNMAGNAVGKSFIDLDDINYYIDPANTGTSLKLAGNAIIGGDLRVTGELSNPSGTILQLDDHLLLPANKQLRFGTENASTGSLTIVNSVSSYNTYADIVGNLYFRTETSQATFGIQKDATVIIGVWPLYENNIVNTKGNKLMVNGGILCEEVTVEGDVLSSDYVFESDYNLQSLEEVEQFINENNHLPDIPSAQEFKVNGYKVGEMDDFLLRKIEELTLYIIDQNKKLTEQNIKIESLEKELLKLQVGIKEE